MAIPVSTHPVGFEAELQRIVTRINRRGLNVKVNSSSFTQPLGRITNKANEFQKSIEASNARVIAFGASAAIIGSVGKAFEQMVVQAVKVEKILTDINVVLNTTSHNLEKFGTQLFDVARNTSQALDVAAEAALEFSRQGLTMEETLSRTNDALILTRLTGMKAADAVKGLTAAVNSYSQAGVTTTEIINKLAAVDVKFAVSADDLVAALSRAGAVAQDAGLSMDQLVAAVTSAQQITARGGAVIGNSFKTIFTRLQRSSTISSLDELGVKVTDVAGRTRGAMDIMTDLAKTYDTLADSTQAAVAEQVGGVFQINILKAAMKDLGKQNSLYSQALGISTGATNEAAVKNAMLQETLSSLAAQTSLTMQELASNIGDLALAPGIETLLKQLNSLGEGLNDLLGGDSEGIGADFAKGVMKGIGNVITGPGMVLAIGVFGKLFFNALKFAKQSLKDILGIVTQKEKEKKLQDSILEAMMDNKVLADELNKAAGNKVKQERIILDTIEEQTRQMEMQRKIAATLAPALAKRGVSPTLGTTAEGFVPNFNQSPNNYTKKKEMREASKGGYSSGAVKLMDIPGYGEVAYNQAEKVKRFRGMKQPAIMPPGSSRAGKEYQKAFMGSHGFDPYAASGFIPNFADPRSRSQKIKDTLADPSNKGIKFTGGKLGAKSIKSKNMFQKMWLESYFKNGLEGDYQMLMKMGYDPDELKNLRAHSKRGGKVNILGKGFIPNFISSVGKVPDSFTAHQKPPYRRLSADHKAYTMSEIGKFAMPVKKRADMSDKFGVKGFETQELKKTISDYNRESSAVTNKFVPEWMQFGGPALGKKLFGKLNSSIIKYENKKGLEEFKKWNRRMGFAGIDPSSRARARGQVTKIHGQLEKTSEFGKYDTKTSKTSGIFGDPRHVNRSYKALSDTTIKGILGEADAKEEFGGELSKGDAFLDFKDGREVKTVKSQSKMALLKKGVNEFFRQKDKKNKPISIRDNLADRVDVTPGNLSKFTTVMPKGTGYTKASGFTPNFASLQGGTLRLGMANLGLAADPHFRNKALDDSLRRSIQTGKPFYLEEDVSKIAGKRGSHNAFINDVLHGVAKEGIKRIGRPFNVRGKVKTTRMKKKPGETDAQLQERAQLQNLQKKGLKGYRSTGGKKGDDTFPADIIGKGLRPLEVKDGGMKPGNILLKSLRLYSDSEFLRFVADKYPKLASSVSSANMAHRAKSEKLLKSQGVIPEGSSGNEAEAAILEHFIARGFVPNFNVKLKKSDGKIDPNQIFRTDPRRSSNDELFKPSEGQGVKQSTVQGEIHNTTTGQTSFGRRSMKTLKASDSASEPSSFDSVNVKKEKEKSLKLLSDPKAMGFIPNFADPLREAIGREAAAGIPKSMMRIERDSSLENRGNPLGLAVTNTRDEPFGVQQGIMRAKARGINPQSHGAGSGFVPSYAAGTVPQPKGWDRVHAGTEKLQGALFSLSTMTYFLAGTFEESGNKIGASINNVVQTITNAVLTFSVVGPMMSKLGGKLTGFSDKLNQATTTRGILTRHGRPSEEARSVANSAAGGGRGSRLGARLGRNAAGRGLSKVVGGVTRGFGAMLPWLAVAATGFQLLAPLISKAMMSAGDKFIEKVGEMAKTGERAEAALALMAKQTELSTQIEDLKNKGSSKTHEEQMKMLDLQGKSMNTQVSLDTSLAVLGSKSDLTAEQIKMLGGSAEDRSQVLRQLERDAKFGTTLAGVNKQQKELVSDNSNWTSTTESFSAMETRERDTIANKMAPLLSALTRISGDDKTMSNNTEAIRKVLSDVAFRQEGLKGGLDPIMITKALEDAGFRYGNPVNADGVRTMDPDIHRKSLRALFAELDEFQNDYFRRDVTGGRGGMLSGDEMKILLQSFTKATNFGADPDAGPPAKDKAVGSITMQALLGRSEGFGGTSMLQHGRSDNNKIFQSDKQFQFIKDQLESNAHPGGTFMQGGGLQSTDDNATLPLTDIHKRALKIMHEEEQVADGLKLFSDEIMGATIEGKHAVNFMKIINKVLEADIALERSKQKNLHSVNQQEINLLTAKRKSVGAELESERISSEHTMSLKKENESFIQKRQDLTKKINDQINALSGDLMRKGTGTLFSKDFSKKLSENAKEGSPELNPVVDLFTAPMMKDNKAALLIASQMADLVEAGKTAADHADIVAVFQQALVSKASEEDKLAVLKLLTDQNIFSLKQDTLAKFASILKVSELSESQLKDEHETQKKILSSKERQQLINSKTAAGARLILNTQGEMANLLYDSRRSLEESLNSQKLWADIGLQIVNDKINFLKSSEGQTLLAGQALSVEKESIGKRMEALILDDATLDARAKIRESSTLLADLAEAEVAHKIKTMKDDEASAQEEHGAMMSQGGFGVQGRNQISEKRRGMQGDVEVAKAQVTQYSLEGNSIRAAEAMVELTNAVKELNVEQGTGTLFSDSIRAKIAEADAAASRFAETLANTSFDSVNSGFKQLFKDLSTGTESVGHNVLKFFASIAEKIQDKLFEHAANRMTSGLFKIFGIDEYHSGGIVTNYNTGGYSKGDVPAMLTTGEYVVRKKAVDKIGQEALEKMNKGESLEDLFDKPNDESFDIIGDGMKEFSPKVNDMQTIADPSLMSNFLKDNSQEPNTPEENSGISEALFENLNQKNSGKESSLPQLISSMVQKRKPDPSKTESKTTSLEKVVSNTVRSKELRNLDKIENNANFLEKITNNISSSKEKERVSLISSLVSNSSKESSSSNSAESTSSSIGKIINNISKSKEVGQSSSISQSQIRDSIVRSDNTSSSVDKMVSNSISKYKEIAGNMSSSNQSTSAISETSSLIDRNAKSLEKVMSKESRYREGGRVSSSSHSSSNILKLNSGGLVSNVIKLNNGGLSMNSLNQRDSSGKKQAWDDIAYGTGMGSGAALAGYLNRDKSPPGDPPEPPKMSSLNTRGALNLNVTDPRLSAKFRRADDTSQQYGKYLLDKYEYDIAAKNKKVRDKASFVQTIGSTLVMGAGMAIGSKMAKGMTNSINGVRMSGSGMTIGKGNTGETIKMHRGSDGTMYATEGGRPVDIMGNAPGKVQSPASQHLAKWKMGQGLGGGDMTSSQAGKWWSDYSSSGRPGFASNFKTGEMQGPPDKRTWQQHFSQAKVQSLPGSKQPTSFYNYKTSPKHRGGLITKNFNSGGNVLNESSLTQVNIDRQRKDELDKIYKDSITPIAQPQRFSGGGKVFGQAGIDKVGPVMLDSGEFVIKSSSVNSIEKQFPGMLDKMNEARGYADGGIVEKSSPVNKSETNDNSSSSSNVTINVNLSSGGSEESQSSGGGNGQALGLKLKAAVLQVLSDEKRVGGMLRGH